VGRRKVDIISIFVFNNLMKFCPIFYPIFFAATLAIRDRLTVLFSMI
jgi:hypothetical protein